MYSGQTYDSVEAAQMRSDAHDPLKPNQLSGRLRVARFTYDTDSGLAQNSLLLLTILPKGARIIEGFVLFGAMGGGTTLDIGLYGNDNSGYIDEDLSVADDVDKIADGIDVSSAGTASFANTAALSYGYETDKEVAVVAKFLGAAFAADKAIEGHIVYVVD